MQNSQAPMPAGGPPPSGAAAPNSFGPGTVSRDALAALLYSGAVRVGTVGLSVAAARLQGPAGAGALGVALQVVALAGLVATLNLPQVLTQRLSRTDDPATRAVLLRTSAALIGAMAALTAAALMLLAPVLARNLYADPTLTPVLIACGPLTLAAAVYQWVEGALQGLRRFGALARWGLAVSVLDLALGVASATLGVVAMLIVRTALRVAAAGIAASRWLQAILRGPAGVAAPAAASAEPPPTSREVARSLLGFAAPTLAAGAVLLLGNALLRVLLVRTNTLVSAGHFQAADSLAQAATVLPLAAAAAFMPAVAAYAGRPDRDLALPFRRAIEQVTGYNTALCLAAMGVAPWLMTAVFGRDFGPSRAVFVVLIVAYSAVGPSALFGAWLMGRGRPWTILAINVLWVVTLLAAFAFGLSRFGAAGAALASSVAYLLALGCYVFVVAPRSELPWSSHLPAVAVGLGAVGAGAALQLLPGVPVAAAVAGNLALAAGVFALWGAPSLLASGLLGRRPR